MKSSSRAAAEAIGMADGERTRAVRPVAACVRVHQASIAARVEAGREMVRFRQGVRGVRSEVVIRQAIWRRTSVRARPVISQSSQTSGAVEGGRGIVAVVVVGLWLGEVVVVGEVGRRGAGAAGSAGKIRVEESKTHF